MIRAYYISCDIISPFLPPQRELCYRDFNSMRAYKKHIKGLVLNLYFGLEKYNNRGKFIKKIKN